MLLGVSKLRRAKERSRPCVQPLSQTSVPQAF